MLADSVDASSGTAEGGSVWRRARDGVAAAVRYLARALGLLRRHPSLLLFPVLIAAFSAVESGVGGYLSWTHTRYGRWAQREAAHQTRQEKGKLSPAPPAVRLSPRWALEWAFREALGGTAGPAGAPAWRGAQQLLQASVYSDPNHPRPTPIALWAVAMGAICVLLLVVNPWLVAGYYGLMGDGVREGRVEWRAFPARARRYWLRMMALLALQLAVLTLAIALVFSHVSWPFRLEMAWSSWLGPLVLVFLALTPILFVTEDAGFRRAVRESVVTIWRRPAVPVVLIVGLTAACFVLIEAHLAVRGTVFPGTVHSSVLSAYLISVPIAVVYYGVLAALGAWAAATLFVWWAGEREQGGGEEGGGGPSPQMSTDEE